MLLGRRVRTRLEPLYEHADEWHAEVPYVPTPETEPAAVWAGQVADVKAATDGRRAWSVEGVAVEVMLPEWNVRRALHQLGRLPAGEWWEKRPASYKNPASVRTRGEVRRKQVVAALAGVRRPVSTNDVADRMGVNWKTAYHALVKARLAGVVAVEKRRAPTSRRGYIFYWTLTENGRGQHRADQEATRRGEGQAQAGRPAEGQGRAEG